MKENGLHSLGSPPHQPKMRSGVQVFQETVIPENTAEDETQRTTKGLRVSQLIPRAARTLSCLRVTKKPWRMQPRTALPEDQRLPSCSLTSVPIWGKGCSRGGQFPCTLLTVPPIIETDIDCPLVEELSKQEAIHCLCRRPRGQRLAPGPAKQHHFLTLIHTVMPQSTLTSLSYKCHMEARV